MANIDVTLKRYNELGEYDFIFPKTHFGQVFVDQTSEIDLATHLTTTYIPLSQKGAALGVATLDSNQKLTISQLPAGIAGGLKFRGSLVANTDLDTLGDLYSSAEVAEGSYWIAGADIELTSTAHSVVQAPGDEGDSTLPITIEAGDWVLLTIWDTDDYTFGIINNTYQDATDAAQGIVTLSSASDTTGTTSKVITESVLGGFIPADNSDLNGTTNLNGIAPAAHHHNGLYYTEGQIDSFFSGGTLISGYNNDNWDAAYNDKINSASFSTESGLLTLTQQDAGTIEIDLDGRYVETIGAGQVDLTDGIVVSNTGKDFTIAHADTSSIADTNNTEGTVIQNATFDTYGHLLTQTSVNLDGRYYTETEFNTWLDGQTAIDGHYFTEFVFGATEPTNPNIGTIFIQTT